GGDFRKWDHNTGWAAFAASQGFIGIVYSCRKNDLRQNFKDLLDFIDSIHKKYFMDIKRISVYAASGHVAEGLPLANNDNRISAALIYYGTAGMKSFRPDLPVLLVRAGLDNAQLNKELDSLAFKALASN